MNNGKDSLYQISYEMNFILCIKIWNSFRIGIKKWNRYKMTTKHFILYNILFTQRSVDNFIDIMAKQKIFSNYSRIKSSKENFNKSENSIIKSNKHLVILDVLNLLLNYYWFFFYSKRIR